MSTRAPSLQTMVVLLAFVVSCVGLTVYMWLAFGGSIPLKPQSYRMNVPLRDAGGLVSGADVRIAGVDVGTVKSTQVDSEADTTVAKLEIDPDFAPRPADTRATLRGKSLLAEVYVELSPGTPGDETLADDGTLPPAQVKGRVGVDDLLRVFDPKTRQALSSWLTEQGEGFGGQAPSFSALIAALEPFERSTTDVVEVMHDQDQALAGLIRDSGGALSALTERRGQLRELVSASSRAFGATASRDAELADTIRVLPTFLRETRATSRRVAGFSEDTMPLVDQLIPAARELAPVTDDVNAIAPGLRRLMAGIRPLNKASKDGVPALGRLLEETPPTLERAKPYLGGLIPIIDYLNTYRRETAGAVGNLAATTQATLPAADTSLGALHYARASVPINPEAVAPFPERRGLSQTNPYSKPGSALELAQGLDTFGSYLCGEDPLPSVDPAISEEDQAAIKDSYYTDVPEDQRTVPLVPPCRDSGPLGPVVGGGDGYFPVLESLP